MADDDFVTRKMWNMMCDVMPTIAEDNVSQRSSQFSGEDGNFEQLMVSMLDERDKLMESMRETQERLQEMEARLTEVEKERDVLNRQLNANIPQVNLSFTYLRLLLVYFISLPTWWSESISAKGE